MPVRPDFLTGEHLYVRPLLAADAQYAAAWFDSPFPVNAARAETFLKELAERLPISPREDYVVARLEDDAVIGGVTVSLSRGARTCWLHVRIASWLPRADALRAAVLPLMLRWLREERELMAVTVPVAADEPATIAAAEALGLTPGVRLRERLARPGGRVDQLLYTAYNPRWEVPGA